MWDEGLNEQQLAVAEHGREPLVVMAGAGSGKTRALTARVCALLERGVAPERILLLTFTRRAADDMLARAHALVGTSSYGGRRPWGGTFHAIAYRLVAMHAEALGLPGVCVLDPADATVTMDMVREERKQLVGTEVRLPRSATLVDAISCAVNTGRPLRAVVDAEFPWCAPHADDIAELARAYVARKRAHGLLDFDDLLLAWRALLTDPTIGPTIQGLWDYVLVDEYQDVNQLQVDIVTALRPNGAGLTVVGDEAQSIYGFRGCDPSHLNDLVSLFADARVVKLEQNYRSRQPILDVANAVRPEGPTGPLVLAGVRDGGRKPVMVSAHDAAEEARAVVDFVLASAADGTPLREQAVLMRAAHHSDLVELELATRRVPYRKYGGLRFLEAAHVKDFLAAVRVVVNPGDDVSWFRLLRLHDGVGSSSARRLAETLTDAAMSTADRRARSVADAPAKARIAVQTTVSGLAAAAAAAKPAVQAQLVLTTLRPLIQRRYDDAAPRLGDLARLVDAAALAPDLAAFAAEVTLDPPASTSDLPGPPHLDDDYLVLSTVHSAKGLEWSRVHVIGLVDGAFPSDMSFGSSEGVAEEQRLFYVAVTRARDELHLHVPLRMPHHRRARDDRHSYAPASRFLDRAADLCERIERGPARPATDPVVTPARVAMPALDELWA
ncbi:MAG TPA: ATP-dependent helicase [Mycobacteriales bacterium]|nr:ATP-dependent helicase [Mycobacteriales bacterium]